jgi:hypothetical protein
MTFRKLISIFALVAATGVAAQAAKAPQPNLSTLRRYQNKLSTPLLRTRGVTGLGIGQTRTGKLRLDVMLQRKSAVTRRAVLGIVKDKAPRLSTRFVRFVVTGTIRPE